eukprot:6463479-Lingulodinium_polyedra.AAC.1
MLAAKLPLPRVSRGRCERSLRESLLNDTAAGGSGRRPRRTNGEVCLPNDPASSRGHFRALGGCSGAAVAGQR